MSRIDKLYRLYHLANIVFWASLSGGALVVMTENLIGVIGIIIATIIHIRTIPHIENLIEECENAR